MKTKQELFFELDRFFNSDVPGDPPECIQLILEWAGQPDPSAHHINSVGTAVKQIIAAMANCQNKQVAYGPRIRLINALGDIYNLRADIYQDLDRWYRKWWDKLMDKL